eukprot:scaffold88521_cov18-Prasinocladus_malaysianus.AAC.1
MQRDYAPGEGTYAHEGYIYASLAGVQQVSEPSDDSLDKASIYHATYSYAKVFRFIATLLCLLKLSRLFGSSKQKLGL